MTRRLRGETTCYRLEEGGTITVRQGNRIGESLRWEDGSKVRAVTDIGSYPDGGVWFWRGSAYYEIGRDDVPRAITTEDHKRRMAGEEAGR